MSFPPPAPPDEGDGNSLKRSRESGDLLPPAKRSAALGDVVFRVLVPSREVGRLIGKAGSQIQRIRADTGATIKIAGATPQHEERVVIISSSDHGTAVSNAESALSSIARLILKENDGSTEVGASMIRILVSGPQAGCLIGISGQNIMHIRSSSGAAIVILAQNQLPSCAFAQKSDRIVQVSGSTSDVLKALEKIGCMLRENPSRKAISTKPQSNHSLASVAVPHLPPSSEHATAEMMILEKLVGGLIGKSGYNISRIRNESGATIKVGGVKGEGEQRLIHFGGSIQQVVLARAMVENYILSQLTLQN